MWHEYIPSEHLQNILGCPKSCVVFEIFKKCLGSPCCFWLFCRNSLVPQVIIRFFKIFTKQFFLCFLSSYDKQSKKCFFQKRRKCLGGPSCFCKKAKNNR